MNNYFIPAALLAALVAMPSLAKDMTGEFGPGNGGDACENRIIAVRDDIKAWIFGGGASRLKNVDIENYNTSMSTQLLNTQPSCTDDKVLVNGAEKTCKNMVALNGQPSQLVCNFNRFNATPESEQYRLIHHEFAGLAGLEENNGDIESDYRISDQITGFLEEQIVKKLAILPGQGLPYTNQGAFKIISTRTVDGKILFRKCMYGACSPLGLQEGYSAKMIDYHPNFRTLGNALFLVGQGVFVLVAPEFMVANAVFDFIVVGGIVGWVNFNEVDGPVDGIQKANLARRLNNLKSSANKYDLLLATHDLDEYGEMLDMMEDLLADAKVVYSEEIVLSP